MIYTFNDCGVCDNPKRYGDANGCRIKVAQCPNGKWVYGYCASTSQNGVCKPCAITGEKYNSEREAVVAGIMAMKKYIASNNGNMSNVEKCISKAFDETSQTKLF